MFVHDNSLIITLHGPVGLLYVFEFQSRDRSREAKVTFNFMLVVNSFNLMPMVLTTQS